MSDINELKIYTDAIILLQPVYRLANLLPHNELDLRSQILRAAKAIAPMIAEGFAKKRSQKEFKRYLEMALGSSDETVAHLRQIKIINFPDIKPQTCDWLIKYYIIESKQINRLIGTIINNQKIYNLKPEF